MSKPIKVSLLNDGVVRFETETPNGSCKFNGIEKDETCDCAECCEHCDLDHGICIDCGADCYDQEVSKMDFGDNTYD